ncbi:hypothetical protein [Armatimonas rosea]|uniref:Uncharacterized protein n=1 Tax=Armatimonas rosea TaxID=685828 RepID=A0A7W9SQT9_ARMRO|nr:hypothetical protein [Armatimonas rosea]MBB6050513.1 hypothetical protein [Armatimonas rosea]
MTEYELSEILSALEHGSEEQQEVALERLRAVGEQAVEPLVQTIVRYLHAHRPWKDEVYQEIPEAARQRVLRMAFLLVSYGSASSLRVLAGVAQQVNRAPFLEPVAILEERAIEDDVSALISVLRWLIGTLKETVLSLAIGQALVRIAMNHPEHHRQLAYALPLLRRYNLASLAYLRLHSALRVALSTRTLPIPAQAAQTHTDLPIPGEEHRKWH